MLFSVWGRESRSRLEYDYDQGLVYAWYRSETFLLGRTGVGEDRLRMPTGQPLDDAVTVTLNYAEGLLERDPQGGYRTLVVRRKAPEPDGPDGARGSSYRAEVLPLRITVSRDREHGRAMCLLDLTAFSSWARNSDPAWVVCGASRWSESIEASLILGSRIGIRFQTTP